MKKVIIGFILGIIITLSITTLAYNYNAKDIEYNPNDESWDVNNVSDAIDSLKINNYHLFTADELNNAEKKGNVTILNNQYKETDGIRVVGRIENKNGISETNYIGIKLNIPDITSYKMFALNYSYNKYILNFLDLYIHWLLHLHLNHYNLISNWIYHLHTNNPRY